VDEDQMSDQSGIPEGAVLYLAPLSRLELVKVLQGETVERLPAPGIGKAWVQQSDGGFVVVRVPSA
jgi:hypothetical protein